MVLAFSRMVQLCKESLLSKERDHRLSKFHAEFLIYEDIKRFKIQNGQTLPLALENIEQVGVKPPDLFCNKNLGNDTLIQMNLVDLLGIC